MKGCFSQLGIIIAVLYVQSVTVYAKQYGRSTVLFDSVTKRFPQTITVDFSEASVPLMSFVRSSFDEAKGVATYNQDFEVEFSEDGSFSFFVESKCILGNVGSNVVLIDQLDGDCNSEKSWKARHMINADISYFKVILVNDFSRTKLLGERLFSTNVELVERINSKLAELIPKTQLKIQLAVTGALSTHVDIPWDSMNNTVHESWLERQLPSVAHQTDSTVVLLTGKPSVSHKVGVATTMKSSQAKAKVVVVDASTGSTGFVSARLAHLLFKSLSIDLSSCETEANTLMGVDFGLSSEISNISWPTCLVNITLENSTEYPQSLRTVNDFKFCGNGIIEQDEQCDCPEANCDPCCNTTTCKFNLGSECSSLDVCCSESCSIRRQGEVCRNSSHPDCDVEETCDGVSPKCPKDEQKLENTGRACSRGNYLPMGSCFGGTCVPSLQQQCQQRFYGSPCNGQLGRNPCGPLYCKDSPYFATDECKDISLFEQDDVNVLDGTWCSENLEMICKGRRCIPRESQQATPIVDTCHNMVKDQNETDVDCGGNVCYGCELGKNCTAHEDCLGFLVEGSIVICNPDTRTCTYKQASPTWFFFRAKWAAYITISLLAVAALVLSIGGCIYRHHKNKRKKKKKPRRGPRRARARPQQVTPKKKKPSPVAVKKVVNLPNFQPDIANQWGCSHCGNVNNGLLVTCSTCKRVSEHEMQGVFDFHIQLEENLDY
mmetsp:Transcript_27878/g.44667  ORF Transcript_27878/g.44667 Transcript_27878/m.44667 type:complete len:718 (-) Transcript_27878:154-2307(-)